MLAVTIRTGFTAFTNGTFAYLAYILAERSFNSVFATAVAVYHIGSYFRIIQLAPQLGSVFTKSFIIVDCGNIGVAFIAIKSAISNILFDFKFSFCINLKA